MSRIPLRVLWLLLASVFMVCWSGCGKKGPPFLPERELGAKVDQLTSQWIDGHLRLEGTIGGGDRGSDVTGSRVYHAWYPEEHPPCEGCPIEMTVFTDTVKTTVSGDRFTCDVPVTEKKGIWFLEVRLTGSRGAVGPPSERIRVKIEN